MRIRMFCSFAIAAVLTFGGFGLLAVPQAHAATNSQTQQAGTTTLNTQAATSSSSKAAKPAKPSKKQLKKFKKASADFALELFARSVDAKGKNDNVTIAPLSVMNALAVTANGARGKTAKQIRKVLGDGATMSRINKNLAWYNSKLVNVKKARISSANSIWYHNDGTLTMKKKFLKKAKKFYSAEVNPADFSDPSTVDSINAWVAENTNNMIKRIISQLSPDDRIAIVNALYFDAEWLVPYEHGSAVTKKFTNANGVKRDAEMLYGTEYTYIEGDNVTGFIKPYKKGYSFVALLPEEGMNASDYAKTLDGDTFRSLIAHAQDTAVQTSMPKFTLTYTNESMENQLAAMGIKLAFTESANFKGMATDTTGNIFLGRVVHKTKIELDEKGTKAAAATAVMLKASSALIEYKTVNLDRPFVYAIVDNATKLPVFIGTVSDVGK